MYQKPYAVEHYNRVTGRWLEITARSTREAAAQYARATLGSFNSGTRVVHVDQFGVATVTDTFTV